MAKSEAANIQKKPDITEANVPWSDLSAYDQWLATLRLPIHKGYFVQDLRSLELGWWEERHGYTAFVKLAGQEGVTETRVTEIPPGKSMLPFKMALDEIVYGVDGRGLATIWAEGKPKKTFEWQKHSLFLIPRNYYCQLGNAQGEKPARLLHYNTLPLAMTLNPDPDFFFGNPYQNPSLVYGEDGAGFYSQAQVVRHSDSPNRAKNYWVGNFFPDMKAWDRLEPFKVRGAGGHVVWIRYPKSPLYNHMSVFPARTYKKAHRHGPGTLIVIPAGEGYSLMWPEGSEKLEIPWHEASAFVPPNKWFHQHFNVGAAPARYLAFHFPKGFMRDSEKIEDRERDQIEYPREDPIIRKKFADELGKRGLTSLMADEAYRDANFQWQYES
ncbi:MAG: cupin domain-containing protein [Candidatus Binatia bacterium]